MTTEQPTESNTTNSTGRPTVDVPMQTPIKRKGETITTLQIMRPRTGDLRGLLLAEVVNMKADAIATLLPRITVPTLIKAEVDEMDPADLVSCGVEVVSFLVPRAAMESLPV
ncbi:phage tail assembly protein [Paracidovorax valerianellae]|uniref:phage tail assembly protein n=1 Tax=Paracidovorax valerianellae TaxID=187868 RepID=UPI00230319FB|nr:phage tail assembly protein [Paracidovorax valerianellae]MDA8444774.1 phage tail assembly protein [Paracidovorax valerianellae]